MGRAVEQILCTTKEKKEHAALPSPPGRAPKRMGCGRSGSTIYKKGGYCRAGHLDLGLGRGWTGLDRAACLNDERQRAQIDLHLGREDVQSKRARGICTAAHLALPCILTPCSFGPFALVGLAAIASVNMGNRTDQKTGRIGEMSGGFTTRTGLFALMPAADHM